VGIGPKGLLAHVCFGSSGNLRVSEVWESREQLDEFAKTLMPLLQEENVDLSGDPEILDVEGVLHARAEQRARRLTLELNADCLRRIVS
jgi:hypothetical protein